VLTEFLSNFYHIDVSIRITLNWNHRHSANNCSRWVSTMSRSWDKAKFALVVSSALVILANRSKTRELSVSSRVRLECDGVIVGDCR
jgi:hypothetical protein